MKTLFASLALVGSMFAATAAQAQVRVIVNRPAWHVRVGPPNAPPEAIPVAPNNGGVWVPGYHRWDGRQHVWVGGQYQAPPRAYYHSYSAPRWERQGRYWNFHRGSWRR